MRLMDRRLLAPRPWPLLAAVVVEEVAAVAVVVEEVAGEAALRRPSRSHPFLA